MSKPKPPVTDIQKAAIEGARPNERRRERAEANAQRPSVEKDHDVVLPAGFGL